MCKRIAPLSLVLFVAAYGCREGTIDLSSRTVQRVDSIARLANRQGTSGVSIGIGHAGRVAITAGYGWAVRGVWVPVTEETIFPIGEISEEFAAALALRAVDHGRLHLEASVAELLPELVGLDPRVTVRHLLSHTSGLADYRAAGVDYLESSRVFTGSPLAQDPGIHGSYSASDYLLLGVILERVYGKPYSELLGDELLAPLRLRSTHLCADRLDDDRRTMDYTFSDMYRPTERWKVPAFGSETGLCSNAHDLVAWRNALMRGEVLPDSTLSVMFEPARASAGEMADYGMGLRIGELRGWRQLRGIATGQSPRVALAYYPERDLTVAILTNTEGPALRFDAVTIQETIARRILGR